MVGKRAIFRAQSEKLACVFRFWIPPPPSLRSFNLIICTQLRKVQLMDDQAYPYIKMIDCRNTATFVLCPMYPPKDKRIEKINDDFYYVYSTEEFRPYSKEEKTRTRADNLRSIKRAFSNLKALINCNYDKPSDVRFITLTYAENMTDKKRIPRDMERFFRRLKKQYGEFNYIYCKERQERGAWHMHVILFFLESPAPFLPNDEVAQMWGNGFVNIQGFKDEINNLGNYLCAYLTDDKETSKKGARLMNYEAGVRLYNCNKNIKRPIVKAITWLEYLEMMNQKDVELLSEHVSIIETDRQMVFKYQLVAKDF